MADTCSVSNNTLFANCFSGLSVRELLTLQHSLKSLYPEAEGEDIFQNPFQPIGSECVESENNKCDKPATLALMAESRGYPPSSSGHEPWDVEQRPSKLQTLFQVSITALAFLSFGGYLLCLIVQSIKSKGTTFLHATGSTMTPTNGVKRIKVYRRSRRSALPPHGMIPDYNYNNYNYDYTDNYNYGYLHDMNPY